MPMEKLAKDGRAMPRGLYAGFPGLHGAIDSALEGVLGEVFVDDQSDPRVARIVIGDFHAVAGDPDAPADVEALREMPDRDYLAVPKSWHRLVRRTLPKARSYTVCVPGARPMGPRASRGDARIAPD